MKIDIRDIPVCIINTVFKKLFVSLKPNFKTYKNKGYNGGIKIFGTGTPSTDLTLKILFCSRLFKIIPHSFATSSSPKKYCNYS